MLGTRGKAIVRYRREIGHTQQTAELSERDWIPMTAFAPVIADVTRPSRAELNASLMIDNWVSEISGFPPPDVEGNIPVPTMTFHDRETAASKLFAQGVLTHIIMFDDNGLPGDKMDVYRVTVVSRARLMSPPKSLVVHLWPDAFALDVPVPSD